VWVERGGTKKLTVAFHFLRGDQSRWKCDSCRRQGLERRRRCGFLPEKERGPARWVWVRGSVGIEECPRSFVTPQSLEWVERFVAWRAWGGAVRDGSAREAEAFDLLEAMLRAGAGTGEGDGD
jgi:hypothetical protein